MRTALFTRNIASFIDDERAGTHIEYAIIGGFTGVLLMGGLLSLEGGLSTFYTGLAGILASVL